MQGEKKERERTIAPSRKKNLDHSRLPAVDRGLGDYTQWVHLACPHQFWSHLPRPSGRAKLPKTTATPSGCSNSTRTTRDCAEEDFLRTKTVGKSTHLDIGPKGSTSVVGSLTALVHYLHPLHHHISLSDGFRSHFRLVVWDGVAGEKVCRRPRCGCLKLHGVELDS